MSCYFPWSQVGTGGVATRPVACGQCIGCRLERSRQWAVRCMHEASLHEFNVFVTLTYNDEFLPANGSLCYRHFQLFMKVLRRTGRKVRFFVGGEYGEDNGRPHYHAILFNCWFPDMKYWRTAESGYKVYRSAELESLWTYGNSEIGTVTFESAGYCSKYIRKKLTGVMAANYGEREPEFGRMSLKPGIGYEWFKKYGRTDVLPDGKVVVNGVKAVAPKYYRNKIRKWSDARLNIVRLGHEAVLDGVADSANDRLRAKEAVRMRGLTIKEIP